MNVSFCVVIHIISIVLINQVMISEDIAVDF